MEKDLLIEVGLAAYGANWKSPIQRDLGFSHRQRVNQWVNGERPIPNLEGELILILNARLKAIVSALSKLQASNCDNGLFKGKSVAIGSTVAYSNKHVVIHDFLDSLCGKDRDALTIGSSVSCKIYKQEDNYYFDIKLGVVQDWVVIPIESAFDLIRLRETLTIEFEQLENAQMVRI